VLFAAGLLFAAAIAVALSVVTETDRLAGAIRRDSTGVASAVAVRHADSGPDYVEVTLRAGASTDDAHRLWCQTIVPNGGMSAYDDPLSGTYVATLDSQGADFVFPIGCP
jgi:hypothetical protein